MIRKIGNKDLAEKYADIWSVIKFGLSVASFNKLSMEKQARVKQFRDEVLISKEKHYN